MRPEIFALLGGFLSALLSIYYRIFMRERVSAWALTSISSLFGFLFLSAILTVHWPLTLRLEELAVLLVGNIAWSAMVYFDTRAYEDLDVSLNHLLDSARLVILVGSGVFLFGESLGLQQAIGIGFIIASILYGISWRSFSTNIGTRFRAASLAAGTIGMLCDKFLTTRLDLNFVIVIAYLLPGLFILAGRPSTALEIPKLVKQQGLNLLWACIIYSLLGWSIISAIGVGDLGAGTAIYQSKMVFSLILGALFLRERDELKRRSIAIALCLIGILALCFK